MLYCFYKIILKIRANLKCHNRVYILSSKNSYRPMRARVVAQLFYKIFCIFLAVLFLCDMPRNRIDTPKSKRKFYYNLWHLFHRNRTGGPWPSSDELWRYRWQCWPIGSQLRECCCWTSIWNDKRQLKFECAICSLGQQGTNPGNVAVGHQWNG